jgi:hypothetical protein
MPSGSSGVSRGRVVVRCLPCRVESLLVDLPLGARRSWVSSLLVTPHLASNISLHRSTVAHYHYSILAPLDYGAAHPTTIICHP